MQAITQKLARRAYALVSAVETEAREDYRTRALTFPAVVMQSGLVNAVGFGCSKRDKDGYARYLRDLESMLQIQPGQQSGQVLHERARTADLLDYRKLTRDVLAAAVQLKRAAEILIAAPRDRNAEGEQP